MAKLSLMDSLGCAIAGSQTDEGKAVRGLVRRSGCNGASTLIGDNHFTSPVLASFANGTMMHSLEFDDIIQEASMHPGAAVNSAALAAGEHIDSHGRSILTGIVCGYDVAMRVAMAFGQKTRALPAFHMTGICGSIGAAAAAGKLLDLNEEQIGNAMALAATIGGGIREYGGAMAKRMYPGKAAENGILCSMLAQEGFTGPEMIFEAEGGFLTSHLRAGDEIDLLQITKGLENKFWVEKNGFKLYSCCSRAHTSIDAALEIAKRPYFSANEVEEVTVKVSKKGAAATVTDSDEMYHPKTKSAAQFSLPYCVAAALVDRAVSLEQFTEKRRGDANLLEFVRKVRPVWVEEYDKYVPAKLPAVVEVRFRNGQLTAAQADVARGNSANPASAEELRQKFLQLSQTVLAIPICKELLERLDHVDQLSAGEIGSLLRKAS
jgi:2-methylcitrate dehydratase PrpD